MVNSLTLPEFDWVLLNCVIVYYLGLGAHTTIMTFAFIVLLVQHSKGQFEFDTIINYVLH